MSGAATCGLRCRVVSWLLAGAAGLVFGIGLLVADMTRPDRVLGFLDVTRDWDPMLAFVMVGGIAAYALLSRALTRHRRDPWFDMTFHRPTRRDIDRSLVVGAAIFGVGWGLGGFCPGPGLVAAAAGSVPAIGFVIAMLAGMLIQHWSARGLTAAAG